MAATIGVAAVLYTLHTVMNVFKIVVIMVFKLIPIKISFKDHNGIRNEHNNNITNDNIETTAIVASSQQR